MRKLILLAVLLSTAGFCYGQNSPTDHPEVVPPPPSVASLMRFEEVPVDYYTGQPNISIPLGNVSIHKGLSYPIALRYNTQGIRVDERSGWTGTGFSMSTGGTISRTIKGLPDELNHPLKGKGIYHNNYYNFDALSNDLKQEFLWNSANGKNSDRWDADQDMYQYSYLGGSGRFIVIKQGSTLTAVVTESSTNEKINLTYDTSTFEITKFEIIDTNGYIYTFEEHNENRIISYSIATSQVGNSSSATGDYMGNNDVPNAWYLKDIKLPNNEVLCSFSYQTVEENYHTPYSSTRNALASSVSYGNTEVQNANKAMLMPKFVYSNQTIESKQKYVDEVTFRDGAKVKYNLDSSGHPEYGVALYGYKPGGKLSSIQIFDRNGIENKKIELEYATTSNTRMFLTEVKEVFGTGKERVYTLAYNNEHELPAFNDEHQDVWGYYNGPNSTNPNFLISGADPEKATTGALASITYPTGGKKEFVFESNTYGYEGADLVDPKTIQENRVLQQRLGNLSITNLQQTSPTRYLLYIDSGQKYRLTTSYTTSGNVQLEEHKFRIARVQPKAGTNITDPTGPTTYIGYNTNDFEYVSNSFAYTFDIANTSTVNIISSGWYFVELGTPQPYFVIGGTGTVNVSFDIDHSAFQLQTGTKKGGGIRIKEILFTDQGVEKRKVEYGYLDNSFSTLIDPVNNVSSGSFEVNPNTRSYTKTKSHPFFSDITCNTSVNPSATRVAQSVTYEVTRDISAIYTPNTKGNYVGYKHVLKKESGNGSQLFTYTSPRDVQIQTSEFTSYPFKPQENLDYKRGVLEKKEVYKELELDQLTPDILQGEVYEYWDVSSVVEQSLMTYEAKNYSCPWTQFYDTFYQYQNSIIVNPSEVCGPSTIEYGVGTCYNVNPDMTSTTYDHRKGIMLPKKIIKSQYFYNGSNLSHTVVSTDNMIYNAKNRLSEKTTEFNEAGALVTLKQKMFYPYNEPSTAFTVGERSIFDQMEAKNIIATPIYSESYRNTDLMSKTKTIFNQVTTNNFQPVHIEAYKANETQANKIDFVSYDEFGNLHQASKRNGTEVTYIWGYDKMLPVAKIENATYTQISSYVANIQNLSNNDDDRTMDTVNTNDTISYVGSEGALRQALQNLRAAFPNAMITSFTYDPLIGVTSITDPRGQTVYYEYDDFHRLKQLKDAYKKIVSENQYHYKN